MTLSDRTPGRWTEQEDDLLRDAVADYNDEDISWHGVASHVPGRNNKVCRKRWVYTLAAAVKKGCWDHGEDTQLRTGVEKHGFRWSLVSQVVGSRLPDQCSRRWHECLNPNINHSRWSLLEDRTLEEAVRTYGRKWTEIVERFFPDRSPLTTKNRIPGALFGQAGFVLGFNNDDVFRYIQRFQNRRDTGGSSSYDIPRLSTSDTMTSSQSQSPLEDSGPAPGPDFLLQVPDYSQLQSGQSYRADISEEANQATLQESISNVDFSVFEMSDRDILGGVPSSDSVQWTDPLLSTEQSNTLPALSPSMMDFSNRGSLLAESDILYGASSNDTSIAGSFPSANYLPPHTIFSDDSNFLTDLGVHQTFPDRASAPDPLDFSSCFLQSTGTFCDNSLASGDSCHQINQHAFFPQPQLNEPIIYDEMLEQYCWQQPQS